ncbi:hypothetical protein BU16DRAFT_523694 [Lophium mytilinum]|uniref:Uncharacterized protein n=1 Tax=Lophium mytilinum TaxID=390894 RepID=A0A6A6R374_9PEZI|nr:hypothetical protein BU16DRAFT_523694 [Lophium mytilinum]
MPRGALRSTGANAAAPKAKAAEPQNAPAPAAKRRGRPPKALKAGPGRPKGVTKHKNVAPKPAATKRGGVISKLDSARADVDNKVKAPPRLMKDGKVKATVLMHQYLNAHRPALAHLTASEQRKRLYEMWHNASENPKNAAGGAKGARGVSTDSDE